MGQAENKGAVAYIGSSPSTYWFEDFYWAVGAFPIQGNNDGYVPTFGETTLGVYDAMFTSDYVTVDATVFLGNLVVTEVDVAGYPQHSNPLYYWEAYNCLGDPSLVPYYTQGEPNTVDHMPTLPIGMEIFTVAAIPGSYVAISKDGILHGAALVDETGSVEVPISAVTVGGDVNIVVTKPQYIPYMVTIPAAAMEGPYMVVESYINMIDFGQTIDLDIALKNAGADPTAGDVIATVTTSDANASIANGTYNYGTIAAGAVTAPSTGAFSLTVADDLEDQYIVEVDITITDGTDTWNETLTITINAPVLEFGNMTIDDGPGGNGRLDPGETADITVPVLNNGNSDSPGASALLSSVSSYVTINNGATILGVIGAGGFVDAVFNISCDPLTPIGTAVDLTVDVDAGEYEISKTFYQSVGLVLEDWETGGISCPWEFAGSADWVIDTSDPYEGTYCVKSGVISHSETSELVINVETTVDDDISFYRKVSSESGYDYLQFWIDGTQQEQWAGEVPWGQVSYFVAAGVHTFKWVYYKDINTSNGSDCAWVDYIIFPSIVPPPCPEIELSVTEFEVTLPPGENTIEVLTISNLGQVDLNFNISKQYITNKSKAYCTADGNCDEYIDGIEFGDISNLNTGCSNYSDYTSLSTIVVPGNTYPITIHTVNDYAVDDYAIWIDWNENESFDDPGEEVICEISAGAAVNTFDIIVPTNVNSGNKRMRIRLKYSGDDCGDPCGSTSWGEVEDYTVIVNSDFVDWLTIDPMNGSVSGSGSANIDFTFDATDLDEGDYFADVTVESNDPDQPSIIVPCTLHVGTMAGFEVNLTVFLEGPFNGTNMNTDLIALDDFPLSQPFYDLYGYNGGETAGPILEPDIVDWVLVELRDANAAVDAIPGTILASQAGFVLNDGSVVGVDGNPMFFDVTFSHGLYAIVYTRNHLGVLSAFELIGGSGTYSYDFSTGMGQAFGNSAGYKYIGNSVWGMVSGDGNCDGEITLQDEAPAWEVQAGEAGYNLNDHNMDGQVDNQDKDDFILPNVDKVCQVPE